MTDPLEEYLATKTAADAPDPLADYLAKKAAPASSAPAEAAPDQSGFFRRAGRTIAQGARDLAHVGADQAMAMAHVFRHPIDSWATPEGRERTVRESLLTNPSKRRELERGLSDTITAGYAQKLGEHVDASMAEAFPGTFERHMAPEQTAADAEAAPGFRTAGQTAGLLAPNPLGEAAGVAGKVGGALVERAAPAVASKAASIAQGLGRIPVVGGAGKSFATYEATAPLQAAVSADAGGDRLGTAKAAALDPTGVLLSTAAGAAGGLRRKALNSEGAKAREYIEQRGEGARVGPLSAGKGGVFDAQLAGVPRNDAGIGQASKIGAEGIVNDIEGRHENAQGYPYRGGRDLVREASDASKEAASQGRAAIAGAREERRALVKQTKADITGETSQRANKIVGDIETERRQNVSEPYRVVKEQIDSTPEAKARRDVAPIVAHMQDAVHSLETSDFARAKLDTQLALLERHRDPASGAVMLSEREINELRRSLSRHAKLGQSDVRHEADAPLRKAALAAREMVDQGPYKDLNRVFAEGASEIEGKRKAVGLKSKPGRDRAAEVEGLTKRLRKGINDPTQIPGKEVPAEADLAPLRQKLTEAEGSALSTVKNARIDAAMARAELGAAKEKRAAGDAAAAPDRKLLGLKPKIGDRETDLNQVALKLDRKGQDTATAGRSLADLEAYAKAHPDQATNTRLAELMRKALSLQFSVGTPSHGGIHRLTPTNLYRLAQRNAPAITGRLLYTPAKKLDPVAIARALGVARGANVAKEKRE